jgi:hypothetical protein
MWWYSESKEKSKTTEKLEVVDNEETKGGEMRVARNLRSANVGRKIEVASQHQDSDKSFGEDPRKKASIVKRVGGTWIATADFMIDEDNTAFVALVKV